MPLFLSHRETSECVAYSWPPSFHSFWLNACKQFRTVSRVILLIDDHDLPPLLA